MFLVKQPACQANPDLSINHKLDELHYFVNC